YLSVGMALYSETKSREGMEAQAEMRRMTDDVEHISQNQLMENTGRLFHIFDELPIPYAVYKIVYESTGGDAIVLYANRSFTEMTKLSLKDLIGRRVSNFFALDANNWITMAEKAGLDEKSITGSFHDVFLDADFEVTAYPVIGPGFCAFTFRQL
ncbi:MAG: PAS domain-containing protein, partial [Solobacterium sp.]|nr:PAS domain-containing protein [Solobacterium sp.]